MNRWAIELGYLAIASAVLVALSKAPPILR